MFILFPRLRLRVSVFAIPVMLCMLWVEGAIPFLLLFGSAVLHEAGHLLALRFCGFRARRTDVLPMGALIVCPEGIPDKKELIIALCGPLASLVCALFGGLWFFICPCVPSLFFCLTNAVLAIFNLLPLGKTDGSKALYCFLSEKTDEKRAKRICDAFALVSKLVFAAFLSLCIIASGLNVGVILLSFALLVQIL